MRRILLLLAVAVLLVGSACEEADGTVEAKRTEVTVALDWVPNTNHTGVYVALQQGWYAEAGLDVKVLPYSEGATPETQVAANRATFGFSFQEAVTLSRASNREIVSLAAVIQKNSSAFVTLRDSGLTRPRDLEGKRYAGFGAPFEEAVIQATILCDGGTSGRVQNITTNVAGFQALQARQADFVWIFQGWEGLVARREGVALNAMSPTNNCVPDYYTPVIITSDRMVKVKPDVVRKFMNATARGYEFAISNPNEAATMLIEAAPRGSFPDPELVRESAQFLAPRYKEGKERWGEQDLEKWSAYAKFMISTGLLKDARGRTVTGDLEYEKFFTNEFLPGAAR